jgi:ribonuclease Z
VDLDVVFLGTAASMPTAQRAPAALLVRRGSERLLFDCGEGTQRQLQRSTIGLPDLQEIFPRTSTPTTSSVCPGC